VKAVSVIGAVGKDLGASQFRDQIAGGRHVVCWPEPISKRIGSPSASTTESLGLLSPFFAAPRRLEPERG
jgi:hypothetical protein